MSDESDRERQLREQFLELMLYAPIGFLYEYEHVKEILVRRGKSQVQIAQLMARMAANRRGFSLDNEIQDGLREFGDKIAETVTELGAFFGLAPDPPETTNASPESRSSDSQPCSPDPEDQVPAETTPDGQPPETLADYDSLTAKQILARLGTLSSEELVWAHAREQAGKQRKTVLDRIERLMA